MEGNEMSGVNGHAPQGRQERLPFSALVRPGPTGYEVGVQRSPDGTKWVTIRLETESGSWCKPIEPAMAASLAKALAEAAENAMSPIDVVPNGLILPDP